MSKTKYIANLKVINAAEVMETKEEKTVTNSKIKKIRAQFPDMDIVTGGEVFTSFRKPKHGHRWGPWRYRKDNLTLEHEDGYYEIDLERCNSSAEILDWIIQVNEKTWGEGACVAYLVAALDELLYPQANCCSGGREQKGFNAKKYLTE